MTQLLDVFLASLLAYFLADALFQSNYRHIAEGKPLRKYFFRSLVHLGILVLSFAIFYPQAIALIGRMPWVLIAYIIVNAAIDFALSFAPDESPTAGAYMAGQVLHVGAVIAFAFLLSGASSPTFETLGNLIYSTRDKALSAVTVYAGTMFAGGFAIRQLTRPLAEHIRALGGMGGDLPNAGMYIGWLERILIVTAIVFQSPTIVGLMLTGKSIARFSEMKNAGFAEYYLIGTFLSTAVAIAGGMLIQLIWNGSIRFN
jgi:hypothetical protein